MFIILKRQADGLSDPTFNAAFEELRVDKEKLWYYLVRYYKLLLIAAVIAFTYSTTPAAPLILLIVIHLADAIILIIAKPLGMVQPDVINAVVFYPTYPKLYFVTTIIQQILFILF